MNPHLDQLLSRIPSLAVCIPAIENAFSTLSNAFRSGKKLFLCGNGGSAADAEHWAGELLKGFLSPRRITGELRTKLGDTLADKLQGGLPVVPLTGFLAFQSAFANDCDSQFAYAQLVLALGQPGDVLIGISTSGNSPNVCHAIEAANALGLRTIALSGNTGGRMAQIADNSIIAPSKTVYLIQELHLPIYHCLSLMLEDEFFGTAPIQ
ncbi:MAG TPA: SIS domain-containing protein [Chthoniobacterales bacterium]